MKDYKKSYRGFVILMVAFVVALFALPFIPNADAKVISIIIFNIMNLWMALVTFVIYKTEKIYWFTGISYEEALNTPSEDRILYAKRHLQRFGMYAGVFVIYSVISVICNIPIVVDIVLETIGIVGVAISTINIKVN